LENWDYAELSKMAKVNGGPEQYIGMIKDGANKAGLEKGVVIGVGIGACVAFGAMTGGKKLRNYISKRKKEKLELENLENDLVSELVIIDEANSEEND